MSGEALEILANVERELEILARQGADDASAVYTLAQLQALRGSRQAAIASLEEAIGRGWVWIPWFDLDPIFDGIRDEPRIAALRTAVLAEIDRQREMIIAEGRAAGVRP